MYKYNTHVLAWFIVAVLEQIACAVENCKDFNGQELSSLLKDLSNEQGFPHGKVMALCRYAITGGIVSLFHRY